MIIYLLLLMIYFFFFIINIRYNKNDIPQHPSLKLIANSEQSFGKWSRRLITMEKIKKYEDIRLQGEGNTGHYQFRQFYFYGKV